MSRRYETGSTILTSNKSFEEWGEVFGDEVMASALIDRLVHHCHIVNILGNSYRMRQHRELAVLLQSGPSPRPTADPARRPARAEAQPLTDCAISAGECATSPGVGSALQSSFASDHTDL